MDWLLPGMLVACFGSCYLGYWAANADAKQRYRKHYKALYKRKLTKERKRLLKIKDNPPIGFKNS